MSRNDLRHSAEGTHWTKRNHKYIRKEGNRYIYPSDLKKMDNSKPTRSTLYGPKLKSSFILNPGSPNEARGTTVRSGNGYKKKWTSPKGNFMERTTIYEDMDNGNKARRSPKDKKLYGEDVFGTKSSRLDKINHPNPAAINPSKKQTISNYKKISERHAQETKAKAHAKASNMSANEARLFSQQRANRKSAANGVKELYRMDDGTYIREHGRSDQEFAKKNAKYATDKMHRAKAANGVGAKNQEYAMQKSAEHQRKQAHIKEEANRQKRNIASYRQGNTGNVSDLTKFGVNRAKRKAAAGSGQQTDYRSVSANHAGKEHVNRQANVDYKQYVNRPETVQRKADEQRSENQKRINKVAAKNAYEKVSKNVLTAMLFPGLSRPFHNNGKHEDKMYDNAEKKAAKKAVKATQRAVEKSKKKRIKALKKWEKESKKKIETTNALARDHGISYRRH